MRICANIKIFIIYSLGSPFKNILENAMQHENQKYECPVYSQACPFEKKIFMQRIKLGEDASKEFMDEMMDTVISDINLPTSFIIDQRSKSKKMWKPKYGLELIYIQITFAGKLINWNFGISILTKISILMSLAISVNFAFGLGSCLSYKLS